MGNVVFPVDGILREVSAIFNAMGKRVYLVGGALRDMVRGSDAHDWDLATDALPEEVIALFRRKGAGSFVIPTGIKHGTVTIHFRGKEMEVTTFRSESGYTDGRRPDRVEFGVSIEEDLSRRDFTMNAMAYLLPDGPLVDPFGGRRDIAGRLIRSVGAAEERFAEDGLRPLRAIRFASVLDFTLDAKALAAIPGAVSLCEKVAPERSREELDKIIRGPRPSAGFLLLEETGLLAALIPELASCRGIEQKGFHRFDVLDHSLLALDYAAKRQDAYEVRLAALFHDIGKPAVRRLDENGIFTFYRHEGESSRIAREIFRRFRYPNAVTDRVCHLIEEHMFHYDENWSDAAVRRFIIRAGEENLAFLYRVRLADSFGQTGTEPRGEALIALMDRVEKVLAEKKALSLRDIAVSGNDLIAKGIKPGKYMGMLLNELLEAVLEDPGLNTREKLLEIAEKLHARYGKSAAP